MDKIINSNVICFFQAKILDNLRREVYVTFSPDFSAIAGSFKDFDDSLTTCKKKVGWKIQYAKENLDFSSICREQISEAGIWGRLVARRNKELKKIIENASQDEIENYLEAAEILRHEGLLSGHLKNRLHTMLGG